jgi:hypothetical protein
MEWAIYGLRCRIPSKVRCKSAVKQVEAAQILDDKAIGEAASQFGRTEEVKPQGKASAIIKLDLACVPGVIVLEMTRLIDRIDEYRGCTADWTDRRYEISSGNTREPRGNLGQNCGRQMTEDAVETQRDVDRRVGFWKRGGEIGDVKGEIDPGNSNKIAGQEASDLNLRIGDIEASCGDVGESECLCACD